MRRIDAGHPFAAHLRRTAAAEKAAPHRAWTPADGPLPSLYLSHGAPMLFEMTDWMTQLGRLGPRPAQAPGDPHRLRALGVRAR